ncbi:MAG: hypothetical protein PHE26_05110 [Syntrophomonadaceae bacterium]|nr:hypothetical protein [Syntrophomonadaceae bacterium]
MKENKLEVSVNGEIVDVNKYDFLLKFKARKKTYVNQENPLLQRAAYLLQNL